MEEVAKILMCSILITIFIILLIITLFYLFELSKKVFKKNSQDDVTKGNLEKRRVPAVANTRKINVYNSTMPLPIEHIILTDTYDNIIDIDVKQNCFVTHSKIGESGQGDLFSIDFGTTKLIKEIIIDIDPAKAVLYGGASIFVTIDLYSDIKTWSYTGILDKKENVISVYEEAYFQPSVYERNMKNAYQQEKLSYGATKSILEANENILALKLQEDTKVYPPMF